MKNRIFAKLLAAMIAVIAFAGFTLSLLLQNVVDDAGLLRRDLALACGVALVFATAIAAVGARSVGRVLPFWWTRPGRSGAASWQRARRIRPTPQPASPPRR